MLPKGTSQRVRYDYRAVGFDAPDPEQPWVPDGAREIRGPVSSKRLALKLLREMRRTKIAYDDSWVERRPVAWERITP